MCPAGAQRPAPRRSDRLSPVSPLLAELDADDGTLGGKARSLARLARGGQRTPPGFVVTGELFRSLRAGGPPLPTRLDQAALGALAAAAAALEAAARPVGFDEALAARLAALGGDRFSVRSSFAGEDRAGATAPGIYLSRIDVTAAAVPAAVHAVLGSALTPGALAYALARGLPLASPPVAVLVHRYVAAEAAGAAALGEDGAPIVSVRHGQLSAAAGTAIAGALRSAAAGPDGVEIEWAASGDEVTLLQLRPYQAPAPPRRWPGEQALGPGWQWDAAHNPLPLSSAQAGLVALAGERCRIGLRQKVVLGYLFHAPGGPAPPRQIAAEDAPAALAALRAGTEQRLAALGPAPSLEDALDLFLSVYEPLFGVIQPAARAARAALATFLAEHLPATKLPALLAGVESMARERRRRAGRLAAARGSARAAALSEYLALFGDEAPAWDVAVPTYREAPDLVRPAHREASADSAPADEAFASLPRGLRSTADRLLAVARAAAAVGEDDDWLYARVSATVRRALLALGQRLRDLDVLDGAGDIFHWPLPVARAVAAGAPPPAGARALVEQARQAEAAARRDPPPGPASPPADDAGVLRGVGTGGRAVGRVWRHDGARGPAPADAVLVAATLLPGELPLVAAAALVVETGGPLDHVAAQARESGLPAVVGAAGAARLLADGDLVLVDGDQGLVIRVKRSAPE
jgi:phosphohistidine swiveling domain-containing protein